MRNLYWGFILIGIGILLLLDNLGVADFGDMIRDFWPLLLVFWGLSILVRRRSFTSPQTAEGSFQTESELIQQSSVFGDIAANVTSTRFRGGSVSTVFGASNLDLSAARFAEGEHELRIHGVFGDSRLVLPKDAAVAISATTVFGELLIFGQQKGGMSSEIQHVTASYPLASSRLKISISRVFGRIRVE